MNYKGEYVILINRTSEILNKYDLFRFKEIGSSDNEYLVEAPLIVANLRFCNNEEDVSYLLQDVFVKAYDEKFAGDIEKYRSISIEIWTAYKQYLGKSI